jgi:hypothetical protein
MASRDLITRAFNEGFQLTVDREGLRVVVTDYHTTPLRLNWTQLRELGLGSLSGANGAEDELGASRACSSSHKDS